MENKTENRDITLVSVKEGVLNIKEEPIDLEDNPPETATETKSSTDVSDVKVETINQSDDCILMEYRSAGTGGKGCLSDADSEDSTTSSDDSSDESEDNGDATDAKINKVLSHERDVSPEGRRKIKMNRHGFEDIRTKGELLPEELPPLEELTITVDENVEMNCIGKITSIVGVLVVIQSSSDIPPLNDDTILFLEGHKVLGQVFEIFGPVKNPWYSVRFNDPENIKSKELTVGMPVYCAPKEDCFTRYVFVDSLKQMKGSDASWEDNNEPPDKVMSDFSEEKYIEFSDDESERRAKSKRKNKTNTEEGEKDDTNWDKRNKNEYNQQQRQKHSERQHRGNQTGGNPRHPHPRNRGNPFQGENQQAQRPRFASGQYNRPDTPANRFNTERSGSYRQNRANHYNDGSFEREIYNTERISNFGGPPRFSSGPRFNGNNPSQFQNNPTFGNRNEQFPSSGPQFNGNNMRPPFQHQNNQFYGNRMEQNQLARPRFNGNGPQQQFQQQNNQFVGNRNQNDQSPIPQFIGSDPRPQSQQQSNNSFGNQQLNNQCYGNRNQQNQSPISQFSGSDPRPQLQQQNNNSFGNQQMNNQCLGSRSQQFNGTGPNSQFQQQNNWDFRNRNEQNPSPGPQLNDSGPRPQFQQQPSHVFENRNEHNPLPGHFNGNGPNPPFQQQNRQTFGNVIEQNLSSNTNNRDQFSQNFSSNGPVQRFGYSEQFPEQNNTGFISPERLISPPPPPPPPPSGSFCHSQPTPAMTSQFNPSAGSSTFTGFQENQPPPGIPSGRCNPPSAPSPTPTSSFFPVSQTQGRTLNTGFSQSQCHQTGPIANVNPLVCEHFHPSIPPPMMKSSQTGIPPPMINSSQTGIPPPMINSSQTGPGVAAQSQNISENKMLSGSQSFGNTLPNQLQLNHGNVNSSS